jgi:CHAT domain-containing protein
MKIFLFVLLLPFTMYSQNQNESVSYYIEKGNFEKVLELMSNEKDTNRIINFGVALFNESDFYNAILFFQKSLELGKNSMTEDEVLALYNTIGISYYELNDFENAEKNYNKAINLNTLYSDKYFNSLNALCDLYSEKKDFITIQKQFNFFLDEAKKHKGENSKEYLLALKKITLLYLSNDSFKLAEENCLKFIEVNKVIFGDNSLEYLEAFSLYINLLMREGRLIEAEKYSSDILKICLYVYEENFKQNALLYNQLATIQQNLFKYDLSKSNFIKAIELIEKNYGTDNAYYALFIGNLGVLNIDLNNLADAEFYLKKALEIKEKLQDSNLNNTYSNLAAIYQKTNRCEEAEKYQLKSIENETNKLSETYKTKVLGLALTYNCLKKSQKEFESLFIVSNILKKNVKDITTYMSNDEIIQYIEQYFHHRIYPLSFLKNNPSNYEKLNVTCFEEELMLRNLTINNYKFLQNSIRNSKNSELKLKFSKFIENKKKIVRQNESAIDGKPDNNLILETEKLEKYLVQQSAEFSKLNKSLYLNWESFKSKLNPKEIVIHIVDFTYYNNKKNPDSIVYSAFVVDKNYKFPKFIPLFEEKELALLLDRNKNQQDSTRIDKQYIEYQISELILKPLKEELKGVSTIYLSLSGLTHQINFAALPIKNNQTFGQKFKIHFLNSPGELIDYATTTFKQTKNIDFILYGGIDYDKKNDISKEDLLAQKQNSVALDDEIKSLQTRSGISKFGYLSGTKNEINTIEILAQKNNYQSKIIDDREATEESIKGLDGRTTPFVLHLATHGFFFPDPIKEKITDNMLSEGKSKIFKASDDPLMRSGLVFSGANKSWGKSNQDQTGDDGILTASEISNIDLSACQLVVLSACETGLGEVKGSEGVFGLQRAFKMAGVKNIIMSLWKVPDSQTAELFDVFYSECFAGKSIHEAFHSAQAKMKAKYSPYYWAGFVLLE